MCAGLCISANLFAVRRQPRIARILWRTLILLLSIYCFACSGVNLCETYIERYDKVSRWITDGNINQGIMNGENIGALTAAVYQQVDTVRDYYWKENEERAFDTSSNCLWAKGVSLGRGGGDQKLWRRMRFDGVELTRPGRWTTQQLQNADDRQIHTPYDHVFVRCV